VFEEGGVVKLTPTIITCYGLAESPSKLLGSRRSSNRKVLLTGGAEVPVAADACCCAFPSIIEKGDTAACPGEARRRQVLWWFGVEPQLSCVVRLLRGSVLAGFDLHV
jgi:hypothetical protein